MVIVTDTGIELPLVASPATVAPILGKSDHGVRDDCIAGRIPTMPKGDRSGTHHRIPVARLLDLLGIPYEQYTQGGLFPIAYTKGTDFKLAERLPAEQLTHWDTW